jgi:hypothetical protein
MNLAVFVNYSNQIPIFLGLFGRENLIYESKFDANDFDNSSIQSWYHPKLDTKFYFYRSEYDFLKESVSFFDTFNKCIFFAENLNSSNITDRINEIKNSKKVFIWHYGEVFSKDILSIVQKRNYDLIYSGSRQIEFENSKNYIFDPLLQFRYFRYYIGYYWLEGLLKNIEIPKYNKNISKIFSYVRAHANSSWRTEFIKNINGLNELLSPKDSANDAYDLLYPKYKHFEAINDYLYCNFNLIFDTINPYNNSEWFLTEKTYKGLFFGKPFFLITPFHALNYLKDRGFYLLNFEFKDNIQSGEDIKESIQNFINWINKSDESEIEKKYNEFLEKSKNNRKILFEYLNDYSQSEKIFQTLLN